MGHIIVPVKKTATHMDEGIFLFYNQKLEMQY